MFWDPESVPVPPPPPQCCVCRVYSFTPLNGTGTGKRVSEYGYEYMLCTRTRTRRAVGRSYLMLCRIKCTGIDVKLRVRAGYEFCRTRTDLFHITVRRPKEHVYSHKAAQKREKRTTKNSNIQLSLHIHQISGTQC